MTSHRLTYKKKSNQTNKNNLIASDELHNERKRTEIESAPNTSWTVTWPGRSGYVTSTWSEPRNNIISTLYIIVHDHRAIINAADEPERDGCTLLQWEKRDGGHFLPETDLVCVCFFASWIFFASSGSPCRFVCM